ncbi:gamma-glutamyl-gamma-aminobutyrate hydrolase family protein [Psychrobacillus glaciei]|uniref:Gamma-glutamyl-gamma-aminobutyrate hydrolase family protein n=1 Tax=Psychrobacillus glaciei TaxID=2283160 RepID=A0A5J6SK67_9BACI|nr:gamma-glutamyl-gamma-aminobutyrate hydrolase family protein [Psychrobacillus glaciei]QFF98099.1 gamma-glutamyl-gamma-aminobutyrate hydrolase family protein [Psychrobacillus glaciei]
MLPIIGVSSSLKEDVLTVPTENMHAIGKFGGVPLVLPNMVYAGIDTIAEMIDGLLLTGGGDIDPTLFGEEPLQGLGDITPERDAFEIAMIQKMLELNKPILGLCRGAQILNTAVGGDMYQDINSQIESTLLQHNQHAPRWHGSHFVQVMKGSLLHGIAQTEQFKVNSYHHQANRGVPTGFAVSAVSSDGIVEAIESKNHRFVMGLQWHPEYLVLKNDSISVAIFKAFIDACSK